MATSAFKSTTRRTSIGESDSRTSAHRRSRSLSRFSHRIGTPVTDDSDEVAAPRGRFVNTVRGSGFPEISLDDLAVEFFGSGDRGGERGRSASRSSGAAPASGGTGGSSASQRRGRSVSRYGSSLSNGSGNGSVVSGSGGRGSLASDNGGNPRSRRRSMSVVRYQISDSESDLDQSQKRRDDNRKSSGGGNNQTLLNKPNASNHRQGLRRSASQKELRPSDGYSSHSSILTDEEVKDSRSTKFGIDRTNRAVYAQNKAREKNQLQVSAPGDAPLSNDSHVLQTVSSIMRQYSTKMEESEKRKQDLLSEIVMEEQRSRELSMIVKELLPDPKAVVLDSKPSRTGPTRSTDQGRMSKRLSEEAEQYIEDFISSIEDTDISSIDGERSDTSSSLGGIMKPGFTQSPATPLPLSVEMDGVALPWLKWETANDSTPLSALNKSEPPRTPKSISINSAEFLNNNDTEDQVNRSASSRGSCCPRILDSLPRHVMQDSGANDESESPGFDMEKYMKLQRDEDLLFEIFRQQNQIDSGGMLICRPMYF